jgi:ribosomal protein S18 acetylase RimI-like enzyme
MTEAEFPAWCERAIQHHGEGYGRATVHAAEQLFIAQGKSSIGLDVAGGNDIARALYEPLGYRSIMTSMAKPLDRDR